MIKKYWFLLAVMMGSHLSTLAQVGYNEIHVNNIKTGMHANGSMFMNEDFSNGNFIVPYETGATEQSGIFASGLWMGGLDTFGDLKVSYMTYSQHKSKQFIPGPLLHDSIHTDLDFNKVWKVTKEDIESFLEDLSDGSIDNPIPQTIQEWPAQGNSYYNPSLPNHVQLAPYHDNNNDNIYNPSDGDYPVIGRDMHRVIPSEMLYSVCNTNNPKNEARTQVEIHTLMYAFDCDTPIELSNTIFTRHYISAKEGYQDFKIGIFQDTDIGCYEDDYVGCDTTLNMFFSYNMDAIDGNENGICQLGEGVEAYGTNPPVISTKFLNQKMDYFFSSLRESHFSEGTTVEPIRELEYYNILRGRFKDGTNMTVGGSGYNPESTNYTNYSFHGDPNDPDGWSMYSVSTPFKDPRTIASVDKGSIMPNEVMIIDLAHTFTSDPALNHIETVTAAKKGAGLIQDIFDNNFNTKCTSFNPTEAPIQVYHNPSKGDIVISQKGNYSHYELLNKLGMSVLRGKITDKETNISIDLESGIYYLKLTDKTNGNQHVETLMIK